MKENCWWKYCTDCSKYNWCKRHVRDVILTWSSWKLQHMSPVKFVIKRILFQIFWHRFVTYLWNGRCIRVKYMMLFFCSSCKHWRDTCGETSLPPASVDDTWLSFWLLWLCSGLLQNTHTCGSITADQMQYSKVCGVHVVTTCFADFSAINQTLGYALN